MTLFLRLLLGHMIGDYVLQPFQLVLMKRRGWWGILIHVSIVVVATGIILWPVLGHWWYWPWLLILFIGHLITDRSRTLLLRNSKKRDLLYLVIDQVLHVSLLLLIVTLSRTWQVYHPATLPALTASPQENGLIVYVVCLIFLIWTVPVIEVETMNTLKAASQNPAGERGLRIAGWDRLVGALERIGAMALMLAGFIYVVPFVFLPRILIQRTEWRSFPLQRRFLVKTAISFFSAILTGLVLVSVPLSFF